MRKIHLPERAIPVLRAALDWLRSRLLIVIGTGVSIAVIWLGKALIGDQVVIKAKEVGAKIPGWAAQPIGTWGIIMLVLLALWIAAWVAIAVGVGIWRTRTPKPRPPAPPPPKEAQPVGLSPYEKNAVEAARIFWEATGKGVTGMMEFGLLRPAQAELGKITHIANLLSHPLNELVDAREKMGHAVHDYAQLPPMQVQSRLLLVFEAYIRAARYLHECEDAHGIQLDGKAFFDRYERWKRLHERFRKYLSALVLRSDYANIRYEINSDHNWRLRFREMDSL